MEKSNLVYNNKEIFIKTFLTLNFHSNYYWENEDIIIIQGTAASAAFYILVSITNDDSIWISEEFGTGSDLPEIKMKEGVLYFKFPNLRETGITKYIYYKRKLINDY